MIKLINCKYDDFNFPCGEKQVRITEVAENPINFNWDFQSNEEIMTLVLLVDAAKRNGYGVGDLYLSYIPFSRQDRVMQEGEPLSIKVFADIINRCNFTSVYVDDAHSSVSTALINNCFERKQHVIFEDIIKSIGEHYLISPDGGALKKINESVNGNTIDVIECSKKRDISTGNITGTVVHHNDFSRQTCVIVDDICDGGRTFIEIAKVLKEKNAGKIVLCVTHGMFTKGLEVFNNLIDEIYTKEGKVK